VRQKIIAIFLCLFSAVNSHAQSDTPPLASTGQPDIPPLASTANNAPSPFPGTEAWKVSVTGKLLAEAPMGDNSRAQQFLFKGALLNPLYPTDVTAFDSYNASNMFLVSSSRIGFTASRSYNNWETALVGFFNLNQGAGARSNIREAYASFKHPLLGSFALGNTYGLEDVATIGPRDIICGSGGVSGTSIFKFLPATTGTLTYVGMTGGTNTATKVRYTTSRATEGVLKGFLFGVSYTPNTLHRGEMMLSVGVSPLREAFMPFDLNSLASGVNYLAQSENASFGASFVYLMAGKTQSEKPLLAQAAKPQITVDGKIIDKGAPELTGDELNRCPTRSYQLGATCSLGNFSFSGEWIFNGDSHKLANNYDPVIKDAGGNVVISGITPPDITVDGQPTKFEGKKYDASKAGQGQIWNVAVAYTLNRYKFSVSYMQSSVKTGFLANSQTESEKATCLGWVCGIDRNLMSGLTIYGEVGQFTVKNPDWAYTATMIPSLTQFEYYGVAGSDTPLTVVIIGAKLQF
jgi:predicted porin